MKFSTFAAHSIVRHNSNKAKAAIDWHVLTQHELNKLARYGNTPDIQRDAKREIKRRRDRERSELAAMDTPLAQQMEDSEAKR